MKLIFALLSLILFTSIDAFTQTTFELEPSQSMLVTGKGPGQDGTINPFAGQNCFAIVENTGRMQFSIRIQKKGEIIKAIPIKGGETKKIKLLKDQELYLDSNEKGKVDAVVSYEAIED